MTPEFIIENIQRRVALLMDFINSDYEIKNEYLRGAEELHQVRYLKECLIGEGNIPAVPNVEAVILDVINGKRQENSIDEKTIAKIYNLNKTVKLFFPYPFPSTENFDISTFTTDYACRLHESIGDGIIQNCGVYRTTLASAAQMEYEYCPPYLIRKRMGSLFTETRALMNPLPSMEMAVKIASSFVGTFLEIHPFSNGNGRTARLLLSFLLSPYTVVPLPLYNTSTNSDVWIECLHHGRLIAPHKYDQLASFILECMHICLIQTCNSLDL